MVTKPGIPPMEGAADRLSLEDPVEFEIRGAG
jgi:hypothetical protein